MTFSINQFLSDCIAATDEANTQRIITDLVKQVVADPYTLMNNIGIPNSAKIERLHVSNKLTVLNVVWAPRMTLLPHNHNTWAIIGVYTGREDNIFWRRLKNSRSGNTADTLYENKIEAAGAKSLGAGEVQALGKNIVHSVTNPTSGFTGAIHVYGGDFFTIDRSEWEPETLIEQPYDIEKNLRLFEEENRILHMVEKLKNDSQK